MSKEYPYTFEHSDPHINVKLPQNLPLSDVKKNLIKQTDNEIIHEFEYPYGLKMRTTTRSDKNTIESSHPIVEKDGEYFFDMEK